MKKGYKELLREADAEIKAVDAAEAIAIHAGDGAVFVDPREPGEREREGVIPGAHPCPRGMLEFWVDPESPYAKPVFSEPKRFVFFCAGGWRSALATKTVQEMGLDDVCHIAGGFSAWKAAGGPVEPIAPKTKPA
jgi:rhodanese-related sulfurtransferase